MFHALIVPQVDLKIPEGRVRRRLEAKSLSKAREVQIKGLTLDEFAKLELVDQFYHLRKSTALCSKRTKHGGVRP